MSLVVRLVPVVLLFLVLGGCSGGQAEAGPGPGGVADWLQEPYVGSVLAASSAPSGGGARVPSSDWGAASAVLSDAGDGKVRLAVVGSIREPGDAGFVIDGHVGAEGWRAASQDVELVIDGDGALRGQGAVEDQRFRFDGTISRDRFDLEVEIELLARNHAALPAGTVFRFDYTLARVADPGAMPDTDGAGDGRACDRIEWRSRNVANLSGGPMQMIQVPECVR